MIILVFVKSFFFIFLGLEMELLLKLFWFIWVVSLIIIFWSELYFRLGFNVVLLIVCDNGIMFNLFVEISVGKLVCWLKVKEYKDNRCGFIILLVVV